MTFELEEERPGRPLWLTTLADLSLLLVGFFVFIQADAVDGKTLAASIRAGFGATAPEPDTMPVEIAAITFAPGSAMPLDSHDAVGWAKAAASDPRTILNIAGETDGSAQDVDHATGSATILAADRARAAAALLVRAHAIDPRRIAITTGRGQSRALLTLSYNGGRQ